MPRISPRSTFAVADVRTRRLTFDQLSLFTMLWAGQGLIQLLTYEYFPHDALFGLLLVATLVAIVLPHRTLALATMVVLNLAYSWAHLPYQVNHHLLEDCINLILLGALVIGWMRHRRGRAELGIRSATYEAFAGPARGAVVVMYLWSGIAKANTDFFDPMVGCATTLLGTALHAEQNSAIVAWLATPVTAGTLVTEIALGCCSPSAERGSSPFRSGCCSTSPLRWSRSRRSRRSATPPSRRTPCSSVPRSPPQPATWSATAFAGYDATWSRPSRAVRWRSAS
ncbi:hypothetical protein ABT304_00690 [Nocardioides sp. NPDC000445]|uniref:hypothetical protein n=1 Tax=Nocardioides sp. NPDC000445 TaxID=3154257 RepID=UPI00331E1F6B